jgi:hypothetical protein
MLGRNRAPASVRARLEVDERVLAWGTVAGSVRDRVAPQVADPGAGSVAEPAADEAAESAADQVAEPTPGQVADPGAKKTTTADGARHVVATNLGLWWPDEPPRRIPWHLIVRATWSERGLTVIEADIVDDLLLVDRPPRVAPLETEGKIPPQVRKRVEGSISTTHEVRLDDGPALVIARRVTGQDGQLWLARLGARTPDTERAREQLRVLINRFQADDEARREALLR